MKLGHRHGHTKASPGASYKLDEVTVTKKLDEMVAKLLSDVGNEMIDCNAPTTMPYPAELSYGINRSNQLVGANGMFYSIHINDALNDKKEHIGEGTEVLIYAGDKTSLAIGSKICSNMNKLGFTNRGVKTSTLAELTKPYCTSMIIEVCFAREDVLFNKVGYERIARAIANGIDSRVKTEVKAMIEKRNIIVYPDNSEADKSFAIYFEAILNNANEDCIAMPLSTYNQGKYKGTSVFAVGGALVNKLKYDKIFAGSNRSVTANLMNQHLKKY